MSTATASGTGGPRLSWDTSLGPLAGVGGGPREGWSQPPKVCEQPQDPDYSRLALLICCPSDTGGWTLWRWSIGPDGPSLWWYTVPLRLF